jgi:hypothetical protein
MTTQYSVELPADSVGQKTSAIPLTQASTTSWTTPVHITGSAAANGLTSATAVTPDDTATFTACKGLFLGVAGDVKVKMADSSVVTLVGLAAGVIHPISVTQVQATGTTALSIVRFS